MVERVTRKASAGCWARVGIGDVFEEVFHAEVVELVAEDGEGVKVAAVEVALDGEGDGVGGGGRRRPMRN